MMEDFSGLALPPLFGGHILEAELETGGVELGPGGTELLETDGAPSCSGDEERRELDKNKYQMLSRRCKEIQQVNEKILGRLHQVQRLTRRMRKERRFLMKTLDSYGDDYRAAQLTITLEDEGKAVDSALGGDEDVSSPTFPPQSTGGAKRKRHRLQKDRDTQMESEQPVMTEAQFSGFPSPNSLSH